MINYKELVKQRTSIPGYIEEVERFETWWNKNLATVIAYYDGYYRVFLLVYDPVYNSWSPAVFPTDSSCNYWGKNSRGRHSWPSDARSEASWLRDELIYSWRKGYDNPILVIHPSCDCYRSFETFVTSPYVVKKYSTSYLKPLDVVWTDMGQFHHAGMYLGKIDDEFKVCHFTKKKENTTIDSWNFFLEGEVNSYHPVIPFKNYRDIAGQIVWAKDNSFRKNDYDLADRNCEHFSNMCAYGINFSQQVCEKWDGVSVVKHTSDSLAFLSPWASVSLLKTIKKTVYAPITPLMLNNGKNSICLEREIRDTNALLSKKFDFETEKYENKYFLQEVPSRESCRIM